MDQESSMQEGVHVHHGFLITDDKILLSLLNFQIQFYFFTLLYDI